jgi:2-polyprenyl-3-methyl-5-hydroxy-6-metoxy-1,4-benzoquinol methylase
MTLNTKYRTEADEIMDDFKLEGAQLTDALDKIAKINQLLGGNALTLCSVKKLIGKVDQQELITIVDLGCGNGDMLRKLADYAAINRLNFKLIGIDANPFTMNYAKNCSANYTNIEYLTEDIFKTNFKTLSLDIALLTLTLHHFKDNEISKLLQKLEESATLGIVVNDLHRSKIAYRLFQMVGFVFNLNKMARKDGLTSILRGFKKEELIDFSNALYHSTSTIQWKWAFRYQWIIAKL